MNRILRALAFVALSMLAACTSVTTVNPIGISGGAVSDMRLVGTWRPVPADKDKMDVGYLFVLSRETGPLEGLLVVTSDNDWWASDIVPGKAGEHTLINVRVLLKNREPIDAKDMPPGYFPLRYTVEADGSIQLFMWSGDAIKDAIQNGRIAGTVVSDSDIRITADPKALDAFFAASAPEIFSVPYAKFQPFK